jgi:hypothetical protein
MVLIQLKSFFGFRHFAEVMAFHMSLSKGRQS